MLTVVMNRCLGRVLLRSESAAPGTAPSSLIGQLLSETADVIVLDC